MNNRKKILEMLAEQKITAEEAEKLLSLMGEEPEQTSNTSKTTGEANKIRSLKDIKYLRVLVKTDPNPNYVPAPGEVIPENEDEDANVNVRVPVALIRAGMKLTSIIPPNAYNKMDASLKEKGIDFDLRNIKPENIEELIEALGEMEINVDSKNKRKNTTVRVYAE